MNSINPINLIVTAIYYILVAGLALFSIFAVYILMRYGRNKILGLSVCLFYAILFLALFQQSHQALLGLQ